MKKAYAFVRMKITEPVAYAEYMKITPGIIAQYGGRFIVRGGDTFHLEGEALGERLVLIEFPSVEAAKAFYHSPEYAVAKSLRAGAADFHFTIFDGCLPPESTGSPN